MQIFEKLLVQLKTNEVKSFRSWLFVVTRNECLMAIRSKTSSEKLLQGHEALTIQEEYDMEHETLLNTLENSIDLLNEDQALCLKLFYFEKLSYDEISTKKGYSVKEVKSHLQNGKRNLKTLINKNYGRA